MARFHHLWVVQAEMEIRNPEPERESRCERVYAALARFASDETEPYPTQVGTTDDGWLQIDFPVWAPTRWAAVAAGATILSEVCAVADVNAGVVRMGAGESADELKSYRTRVHDMEERGT